MDGTHVKMDVIKVLLTSCEKAGAANNILDYSIDHLMMDLLALNCTDINRGLVIKLFGA